MSSYWARLVFSGQTSPPFQVPDAKTALELVREQPQRHRLRRSRLGQRRVKVVLEIKP